jgi:hypothetical protein
MRTVRVTRADISPPRFPSLTDHVARVTGTDADTGEPVMFALKHPAAVAVIEFVHERGELECVVADRQVLE